MTKRLAAHALHACRSCSTYATVQGCTELMHAASCITGP